MDHTLCFIIILMVFDVFIFPDNRRLGYKEVPSYMLPIHDSTWLPFSGYCSFSSPTSQAPEPVLTENDVIEPPQPSVVVCSLGTGMGPQQQVQPHQMGNLQLWQTVF